MQFLYKRHVLRNTQRFAFASHFCFFVAALFLCNTSNIRKKQRRHTWTGYKWNEDARVFYSIYSKHDNSTLTTSFQFDTWVFRFFFALHFVLLGLSRSDFHSASQLSLAHVRRIHEQTCTYYYILFECVSPRTAHTDAALKLWTLHELIVCSGCEWVCMRLYAEKTQTDTAVGTHLYFYASCKSRQLRQRDKAKKKQNEENEKKKKENE